MPRYRFGWSNLPREIALKLSEALDLEGDPVEALRGRFGARPKVQFVQEAWPALLAAWLPTDPTSRQFVVDRLRAAGLGHTTPSVRTKQDQLEYLASCRNGATLREVVLAAFLIAGEPRRLEIPPARHSTSPTATGTTSSIAERVPNPAAPTAESSPSGAAVADFDDWLDAVLKHEFGFSEVYRDSDGDVPLPRGSAMVYIRNQDTESDFVEIFSPILHGFEMSDEIYEAVNTINAQLTMAKATVYSDDPCIVMTAHLFAQTLTGPELRSALDLVSGAADYFDTLLQKRFGGSTMQIDSDDEIDA